MAEEKVVLMCAYCMREFGLDANFKKAADIGIKFSHGMCPRHFIKLLTDSGISQQAADAALKTAEQKEDRKFPPDLAEHPELVKQYKNDIFTPEAYRQSIKEMLQKRAGIVHS